MFYGKPGIAGVRIIDCRTSSWIFSNPARVYWSGSEPRPDGPGFYLVLHQLPPTE